MSEQEIGRAQRGGELRDLLERLNLVRTGEKGFPQDGQHYIGRDGLSIWLQTGPRGFSSTADLFEFLAPKS